MQPMSVMPDFSLVPRRLADALCQEIIYGDMQPDARMIEEDIASRFGVSRSPVREALRLLQSDGLVVREDRRGVRISPMNRRDLDEVYMCRIPLEGIAAAEAALRWKPPEMSRLMEALAGLEKAFRSSDIIAYFKANVALTDAVNIAADNITVRRLLDNVGKQALRYRYFAYRSFPQLMATSIDGNRDIVSHIHKRDSHAARSATERLIETSWARIRDCLPE